MRPPFFYLENDGGIVQVKDTNVFFSSSNSHQRTLCIHSITTFGKLYSADRLRWTSIPISDSFIPTTSGNNVTLIQEFNAFNRVVMLGDLSWLTCRNIKHSTGFICTTRNYLCAVLYQKHEHHNLLHMTGIFTLLQLTQRAGASWEYAVFGTVAPEGWTSYIRT